MLQAVGSQRDPTQRLSRSMVLKSRVLVPPRAAHVTQPEGLGVQSCCSRGQGVLPFFRLDREWTFCLHASPSVDP